MNSDGSWWCVKHYNMRFIKLYIMNYTLATKQDQEFIRDQL